MSAVFAIAILFAMVAVFVKAVQSAVDGMPAWQAIQVAEHHKPVARQFA